MAKYKVLSKNKYPYPQNGFVSLLQYMFVQRSGKRFALLRFRNDANETLTGITFNFSQYNADGVLIAKENYRFDDLEVESGLTFGLPHEIEMVDGCVDIKVDVSATAFGAYNYLSKGDRVPRVDYRSEDEFFNPPWLDNKKSKGRKKDRYKPKTGIIALIIVGFLAVILATSLASIEVFVNTQHTFSLSDIEYEFDSPVRENGTISIVGYNGLASTVVIPHQVEGMVVSGIKDHAFANNSFVENLYVYGDITIGESAFYNCRNLNYVEIQGKATIADGAFKQCGKLKCFYAYEMDNVGDFAFASSPNLESVKFTNLSRIGNNAFSFCSGLQSVEFVTDNDTLLNIGVNVFEGCQSIKSVAIEQQYKSSKNAILKGAYNLRNLYLSSYSYKTISQLYDISNSWIKLENLTISSLPGICYDFCSGLYELKSVKIENMSSTTVEKHAFSGCRNLRELDLPVKITKVGERAFANSGLTCFDGREVTSFGRGAFSGCSALNEVNLQGNTHIVEIVDELFYNCTSLTSIVIPVNVSRINTLAFNGSAITNVTFDGNVTTIDDKAFADCNSLTSFEVPESVSMLGDSVFVGCTSLQSIKLPYNLVQMGAGLFQNCSSLDSVNVPSAITEIADMTFFGCSSLAHIDIPRSVTTIGDSAFAGCTALKDISLPDNLSSVAQNAFGNSGLTSFTLPNGVDYVGADILRNCTRLLELTLPYIGSSPTSPLSLGVLFGASGYSSNSFMVPSSLRKVVVTMSNRIADYTFYQCKGIEEVVFEEELQSIGNYAFSGTSIKEMTVPATVERIGLGAFSDCAKLYSLTLPFVGYSANSTGGATYLGYIFGANTYYGNSTYVPQNLQSVTVYNTRSIGAYAFYECGYLQEINLPDDVVSIGDYAFSGTGLQSIDLPSSLETIGYLAFEGCQYLMEITMPFIGQSRGSTDGMGYILGSSWEVVQTITLTEGTALANNAFYGLGGLTTVNLPDGMASIGDYAFGYCTNLSEVALPDSIVSIGFGAFQGTSFESFDLSGTGVTVLADNAFYDCQNLARISLPNSLQAIGGYVFSNCAFTEFTVPDSVDVIGDGVFLGCNKLTELTVPFVGYERSATYGNLGRMFGGDTESVPQSLRKVNVTDTTVLPYYAFAYLSMIEEVTLPENLTRVGAYAFSQTRINNIELPSTVTLIDDYAFYEKYDLTELDLPSSLQTIGYCAFAGTALTSVVIPDGVTDIGAGAFAGCNELRSLTVPFVGGSRYNNTYLSYIFDTSYGYFSQNGYMVPSSLKELTITDQTDLHPNSLMDCAYLTSVNLPNCLQTIGYSAFAGSGLTSLIVPNSVSYIGAGAFAGTALTSIVIPDGVTDIGAGAFAGCNELRSLTLPFVGETASSDNGLGYAFGAYGNASLGYLPQSLTTLTITGSTRLKDYALYGANTLTTINLPSNLNAIGNYALAFCGITEFTVSDSVTSIGEGAFYGCSQLQSLSVPFVGGSYAQNRTLSYVFGGNAPDSLAEVVVRGGTSIGKQAFYNLQHLERVVLPSGLEVVEQEAFYHCGVTEIDLSSSRILQVPLRFASETPRLKTVKLPSGVTTIVSNAFENSSLENINFPSSLTSIAGSAFASTKLITVDLSRCYGLISLSSNSFARCTALEDVKLPTGLQEIGSNCFNGCTRLSQFTIGENITYIGSKAFYNCTMLYEVTDLSPSITVDKGSASNGYVGYYALRVYTSASDPRLPRVQANGFTFVLNEKTNVWEMVSYDRSLPEIVFPIYIEYGGNRYYDYHIPEDFEY